VTDLAEELDQMARWRTRPKGLPHSWFERLCHHEFAPPSAGAEATDRQLAAIVRHAVTHTAFWAERFEGLGLTPDDVTGVSDLPRLPVLTKQDVIGRVDDMRASTLPDGDRVWGHYTTSGTTGRPAVVWMNLRASRMFGVLLQRTLRWCRWDPMGRLVSIRVASTLPRHPEGRPLHGDEILQQPIWPRVGQHFFTGPSLAVPRARPLEDTLDLLRHARPDYLVTYPGTLETLAYAAQGLPVDSLKGVRAISAMLPGPTRERIESAFGLPVHQNYGLNEVGIVANRCEAGRYHVNMEHCLVEIVDDDGQPVAPGETGRLLVTALQNTAMPLLRYDTTDIAEAVQGPCPCGRTLPSFGRILGRYRSMRQTPAGTSARLNHVLDALAALPLSDLEGLRQAQLHQHRSGGFTLRLEADEGALSPTIVDTLQRGWDEAFDPGQTPLEICRVDQIDQDRHGKPQEFTSDFFEAPDLA